MNPVYSIKDAIAKIEHYCAYQERCHEEVAAKLRSMKMENQEIDPIIVHLITHNFLDEERFARCFSRGKHRIKQWGKVRITQELKARKITTKLITLALTEIEEEEYQNTFEQLAIRNWQATTEKNNLKKRKKCCDYLLRKGYESQLVYEKIKELENQP